MPNEKYRTVYSTDPDFAKQCRTCGKHPCVCPARESLPPGKQTAAVHFEKKGRGGKAVTIVKDLQLTDADLKSLGKTLKQTCGVGGTVKDGAIEIQGDQREKIVAKLQSLGYRTKRVGG